MMNNILSSGIWAVLEAEKILKKIDYKTPEKGYVLFETGYGPSGLPHIGTFGEVARTNFVRFAFSKLAPDIKTKLICFSDDMDGLRKVPDNLPDQDMIRENLGKPLTSIPDPFNVAKSYGNYMNSKLCSFLDRFGFEYEFRSATESYKSGFLNNAMLKVLEKYEDIMDIMLPTLGEERRATYSPFMPISPITGKVIIHGVKEVNKQKATVTYIEDNGKEEEISILNGNCKLQWKVDFGARWYALQVDYEIYGKDHYPNEKIYRKICETLGRTPPVNFFYELFLNEKGEKISKSTGNGISVDEWLTYAPEESMSLYMFMNPQRAKRLYFDVIPKSCDEYLTHIAKYREQSEEEKLKNPAFYIHAGNVPESESNLSFSLLLNLAAVCNPENEDMLWGFISKYDSSLSKTQKPYLNKLAKKAISYYNDFIKPNKKYLKPEGKVIDALIELKHILSQLDKTAEAENIQSMVYEIGKKYEFDLKEWFSTLYQVLLGTEQGPRMGSFIVLYGVENTIRLIENKLAQ